MAIRNSMIDNVSDSCDNLISNFASQNG